MTRLNFNREEHFKAKRANMTANESTSTGTPQGQLVAGPPSLQSPPSNMPLVDIGIEKALTFIG